MITGYDPEPGHAICRIVELYGIVPHISRERIPDGPQQHPFDPAEGAVVSAAADLKIALPTLPKRERGLIMAVPHIAVLMRATLAHFSAAWRATPHTVRRRALFTSVLSKKVLEFVEPYYLPLEKSRPPADKQ